jgi:uncharacterized protein (UPF0332 family)
MGLPQDLIAQAEFLARREPKRPKQASLRRAVSSAYYGLFHFLIDEACRLVLSGKADHRRLREQLARGFDHSRMKGASNAFANADGKNPWAALFGAPPVLPAALRQVARTFVQLQEERHEADYSLAKILTRSEVLTAITRARTAMASWKTVKGSPEANAYLLAMVVRSRS